MNKTEVLGAFALASESVGSEFDGGARDELTLHQARRALGSLRLSEIARAGFGDDDLGEVLARPVHKLLSRELASLTVASVKRFLLSSNADLWWQKYRDGLSSETIAALVKIMTDEELASINGRFFNDFHHQPVEAITIGSPHHFGSRLQANSPRDDEQEVLFSILEGLSYGCGDVLISLKPASDDEETVLQLGQLLADIIEQLKLPTRFSILSDLSGAANANRGLKTNLTFQKLAGTSSALKIISGLSTDEFVEFASELGDLYFQTGLAMDWDGENQMDATLAESRAFGLARNIQKQIEQRQKQSAHRQNPQQFMIISSVVGLNDHEMFYSSSQILRTCLEKTALARLHGLNAGLDLCSRLHSGVSPVELRQLTATAAEQARPSFLAATAGNADPLFGYLTTSFREHPRLRRALGRQITSPMQRRLQELGATNSKGEPAAHALTTARLYAQYSQANGDVRSVETLHAEGLKKLEQMKQRGFDLGYGHIGNYITPKQVERRLESIYIQARRETLAVPD